MRKVILLSTVLFATPLGIESYAADCATTSCQTLGYTATSNKGNCLQCPFGNYWFCPESQCDSSYKYTCTGAYQSPSGTPCEGKYKSCACTKSGYSWVANKGCCNKTCTKKRRVITCSCSHYKNFMNGNWTFSGAESTPYVRFRTETIYIDGVSQGSSTGADYLNGNVAAASTMSACEALPIGSFCGTDDTTTNCVTGTCY